jgi:hypothetical protein
MECAVPPDEAIAASNPLAPHSWPRQDVSRPNHVRRCTGDGDMTTKAVVWERLQSGLDPLAFRRGAARTLARVEARPREGARISADELREDFRLDAAAAETLTQALVTGGLLDRTKDGSDYWLTRRFREYALARVVPPLERARAKHLIQRAGLLATEINAKWKRNPFVVAMIAVSGSYMSRARKLPELDLWLIVQPRVPGRSSIWGMSSSRGDAARQIRKAVRALSSFIVVRVVTDAESIPRPFSVAFRAEDMPAPAPIFVVLREWGDSVRKRIARH